tara:strand:- start:1891 stop:2226 length:336 start_codon:yes stop_codon:yes gene_type:complete
MADIPPNGSIIRYAYLWKWQRDNHETEGRKERPVCLTLSLPHGDQTALILLAISGTPPRSDQTTLAIPELERAGLSAWKDAWIRRAGRLRHIYRAPAVRCVPLFGSTLLRT